MRITTHNTDSRFELVLWVTDLRVWGPKQITTDGLPKMVEGTREVKISPDQRQALCYQCHAPRATRQVYSGDDRTPIGVHEGLSCMACHLKHGQQTKPSCSTCHPRLSNCGIAVETMDTSFKDRASKHNIHSVKCTDCHTKGVPRKKSSGEQMESGLGRQEKEEKRGK